MASCSDGDDIYYVNADNELYHQHTGSPEAFKIAEIPDDEVVSGMMADDKFLYYISNKQVLKRIKVRQRYIGNVLFASSQVLYQSPTKITASYLKKKPKEPVFISEFRMIWCGLTLMERLVWLTTYTINT